MKNNMIATIVMRALLIFISVLAPVISTPLYSSSLTNSGNARNIRHLPCISMRTGKTGVCMFALDCVKANGTHLGTCLDRFYFGSCCKINGDSDTHPQDNTIEKSPSLIPIKKPIESNDIPEIVTIHDSKPQKPLHQIFATNKSTTVGTLTTTMITSIKPQLNIGLSTYQTTQNDLPSTSDFIMSIQTTTARHPETQNPIIEIQTKPVTIPTSQSLPITTERITPATRFPPRNSTTTAATTTVTTTTTTTTSTTTTAVPTTASIVTSTSARPLSVSTKKPIVTTAVTKKPILSENTRKPTRPSSTTLLTIKPILLTTQKPLEEAVRTTTAPTKQTTVDESTSFTNFSKKPTIESPTASKLPRPSSTEIPRLNTTTAIKPRPSSKPTKTSSKPTKTSSKPVSTVSARPTGKPRPSSKPTKYQKPLKPITTTTSTTAETTIMNLPTMPSTKITSTATPTIIALPITTTMTTTTTTTTTPTTTPPPPTTTTTTTTPKTTTRTTTPTTIISTTLGNTIENTEATPTTVKITSTTLENDIPPYKLTTTTDNLISQAETSTQSFVTWSSNSDELVTSTTVLPTTSMFSTTQAHEETTETEWAPITSPDGWIMIQNLSTKQPENETTTTEIPSTKIPSLLAETSTENVPTTEKVSLPTVSTTTNPPTITTVSAGPIDRYNMSDYNQVCGRRLFPESRIVGGARSSFGKWPWQISLRQWRNSVHLHKCGAALLNENWAITAAHCVENVPPSELLLRIGEYDLANEDEPYGFQERRVHMVASHPAFDPRTFEYDLALLRFYEPLTPFQPNYLPICVPDDDEGYVGQTAHVTGWGRLYEDGPLPSVLQEVSVPIINNSECEDMYRAAGYIENIPKIFICAGWKKGGSDSCEGDSGGPLVIRRPRDNRWILAGVISWGIGCAMPFQPGVYTRISEFKEWINQILKF